MADIRVLSTSVVNKIAAGEVIERPASVIKELVENSVDAGATRIEVVIEKGGLDLMRVTDSGHGIAPEQLELAVTSHATSKIVDAEDLFQVSTLGFRGEALASIAEVSQMVLRSRTADADAGFELRINGGQREPVAPCSCAVGTSIEVANLFFNTPVRRKFMKTAQTEMGHIGEAFARVALARPDIHFTLTHNNRTLHDLPVTNDWAERVANFFGPDIGESLIPISSENEGITLSGFVVDPSHSRGNNRMQYLFLNGRFIRDRSLQHALGESYRGLLMTGRYPIAFLQLGMPADLVDVNVHPAKLEVRFQDGGRIYSQLLAALRNKFLTTDLTANEKLAVRHRSDAELGSAPRRHAELPGGESAAPAVGDGYGGGTRSPTPQSWQPSGAQDDMQQSSMKLPIDVPTRDWLVQPTQTPQADVSSDGRFHFDRSPTDLDSEDSRGGPGEGSESARTDDAHAPVAMRSRALQIHNRYLVAESEEGMVVIDQHALHERILYEELRTKVLSGSLESQRLLVPEPVPLSPAEAVLVVQAKETLAEIGIEIEDFGGDTVLVSAYPAMLTNHNPAEMVHDVVDLLLGKGNAIEARDLIDELLHMISCKAAIKAGDPLSEQEVTVLLAHRELCQDAHHCPHGRPSALVFSREELDKRFKRI